MLCALVGFQGQVVHWIPHLSETPIPSIFPIRALQFQYEPPPPPLAGVQCPPPCRSAPRPFKASPRAPRRRRPRELPAPHHQASRPRGRGRRRLLRPPPRRLPPRTGLLPLLHPHACRCAPRSPRRRSHLLPQPPHRCPPLLQLRLHRRCQGLRRSICAPRRHGRPRSRYPPRVWLRSVRADGACCAVLQVRPTGRCTQAVRCNS